MFGPLLALVMLLAWLVVRLVPVATVAQQTPLRLSWKPPWLATEPLHIEGLISVAKSVAPPLAPNTRTSFTRFEPRVERRVAEPAKRLESWTPPTGKPGKLGSRLLRVSGS